MSRAAPISTNVLSIALRLRLALADEGGDLVVVESGADLEGHELIVLYLPSSVALS